MRGIFLIAVNDLRLFLKERTAYFWLFGSPLLFAFFLGFANRGPGAPASPRPPVVIENQDHGYIGAIFVQELGAQGLTISTQKENAELGVRIPEDATERIQSREPVKLTVFQAQDAQDDARMLVLAKIIRALIAVNSYFLESAAAPFSEPALRAAQAHPNPVRLNSSFASRRPMPHGHQQSVPGVLVMFLMMNLLIFGGATLAGERREGVLKRMLAQPIQVHQLVLGKVGGLILLGGVQAGTLLAFAALALRIDFAGQLPLLLLVSLVYTAVAAACGVLAGSLIAREDKIVAICVLASMVMAALGGCWWPLEIVPDHLRLVGHLFPSAWAMDAFHQLISFGGGLQDVLKPLAVLLLYAAAATAAAIRFFRAG